MTIRKTIRSTIRRPYYDLVKPGSGLNLNRELNIAGFEVEKTDYALPIIINYNDGESGNNLLTDVYMNKLCKTDFSDVYFEDNSGNKLQHYLHSSGNYEIKKDSRFGVCNWILDNGDIIASGIIGKSGNINNNLYKSTDGGETWTEIYQGSGLIGALFVDSRGYIFIGIGYLVLRSIDGGVTFATVIDNTAVQGQFLNSNMSENINGDLYFGRYQVSFSVLILKSTDGGETWTTSYSQTTNQHVHGIKCDLNTGYIYAGLDGNTYAIVRSIDGANWTVISTTCNPISFYLGDGFRLFGSENGAAIYRTTNDSDFTKVLDTGHTVAWIGKIGNTLIASGTAFKNQIYPQLFKSTDNGETWGTAIVLNPDTNNFAGYYLRWSNVGVIKGSLNNSVIAGRDPNVNKYEPVIVTSAADKFQSLFYVKIPTLPSAGIALKVKTKGTETSTVEVFQEPVISDLLLRYKFDEATGTTITDSSGNNKHGTIANLGTGAWVETNLAKIGSLYPPVRKTGSSLRFNTTRVNVTGSASDADFLFTKNFTVLLWLKTITTDAVVIGTIYVAGKGWRLSLVDARPQLAAYIGDGTSDTYYYLRNTDFNTILDDNQPHMVGFMLDNSTPAKIKFIVDGRVSTEQTLTSDMVASISDLNIGTRSNNSIPFIGDLDDVRIYKKPLTDAEVKSIYESRNLI